MSYTYEDVSPEATRLIGERLHEAIHGKWKSVASVHTTFQASSQLPQFPGMGILRVELRTTRSDKALSQEAFEQIESDLRNVTIDIPLELGSGQMLVKANCEEFQKAVHGTRGSGTDLQYFLRQDFQIRVYKKN